jgi:hypothetical protein
MKAALFPLALPVFALLSLWPAGLRAEDDWRKTIHPAHRPSVDRALEAIAAVHAALDPATRKNDAKTIAEVDTLVTRTSLPFTSEELPGKWKVRSIQGGSLGIFAYPFFPASFEKRDGRLFLKKTSGSQFRHGFLYADGANSRQIFLGVKYVSGEKPQAYSGTYPHEALDGEDLDFDSVGVLVKKAPNHFVLILDATETEYEVYEFKR